MNIKVLLADDHKMIRDGIRILLEEQGGVEVVAEADEGRAAVRLAREFGPDVVIMDVSMPDLNGIEAARQILSETPSVKVIALSMYTDLRHIWGMLGAGATAYISKDSAFDELTHALKAVMKGQIYLSPRIASLVVDACLPHMKEEMEKDDSGAIALSALTSREREVLQLIAEGKSTKEIASDLSVSVKTVETYRQHLMHKLNLHSVAELTKYAIREGITSLDL